MTPVRDKPLTDIELEELTEFLRKHHPPFAREIEDLRAKGLTPELPILLRLLFEDMRRHQAGKETRNVQFLP